MAAKIKDGLFIGDLDTSKDPEFLELNKISNLINLSGRENASTWASHGLVYLTLNWEDRPDFVLFPERERNDILDDLCDFVDVSLLHGISVLLFSTRGVGRSTVAICAYLMCKYCWSFDKSYEFVASKKPDIDLNRGFLQQMRALDKFLQKLRHKMYGSAYQDHEQVVNARLNDWNSSYLQHSFIQHMCRGANVDLDDDDRRNKKDNGVRRHRRGGVGLSSEIEEEAVLINGYINSQQTITSLPGPYFEEMPHGGGRRIHQLPPKSMMLKFDPSRERRYEDDEEDMTNRTQPLYLAAAAIPTPSVYGGQHQQLQRGNHPKEPSVHGPALLAMFNLPSGMKGGRALAKEQSRKAQEQADLAVQEQQKIQNVQLSSSGSRPKLVITNSGASSKHKRESTGVKDRQRDEHKDDRDFRDEWQHQRSNSKQGMGDNRLPPQSGSLEELSDMSMECFPSSPAPVSQQHTWSQRQTHDDEIDDAVAPSNTRTTPSSQRDVEMSRKLAASNARGNADQGSYKQQQSSKQQAVLYGNHAMGSGGSVVTVASGTSVSTNHTDLYDFVGLGSVGSGMSNTNQALQPQHQNGMGREHQPQSAGQRQPQVQPQASGANRVAPSKAPSQGPAFRGDTDYKQNGSNSNASNQGNPLITRNRPASPLVANNRQSAQNPASNKQAVSSRSGSGGYPSSVNTNVGNSSRPSSPAPANNSKNSRQTNNNYAPANRAPVNSNANNYLDSSQYSLEEVANMPISSASQLLRPPSNQSNAPGQRQPQGQMKEFNQSSGPVRARGDMLMQPPIRGGWTGNSNESEQSAGPTTRKAQTPTRVPGKQVNLAHQTADPGNNTGQNPAYYQYDRSQSNSNVARKPLPVASAEPRTYRHGSPAPQARRDAPANTGGTGQRFGVNYGQTSSGPPGQTRRMDHATPQQDDNFSVRSLSSNISNHSQGHAPGTSSHPYYQDPSPAISSSRGAHGVSSNRATGSTPSNSNRPNSASRPTSASRANANDPHDRASSAQRAHNTGSLTQQYQTQGVSYSYAPPQSSSSGVRRASPSPAMRQGASGARHASPGGARGRSTSNASDYYQGDSHMGHTLPHSNTRSSSRQSNHQSSDTYIGSNVTNSSLPRRSGTPVKTGWKF